VAEAFTCGVDGEYRSACKDLPKYPGTRYCVLHEPGEEKSKEDFLKVKESKLARKDYDFGGAIFPEGTSNFEGFEFDANVAFTGAAFSGTADFRGARFSGERTYFSRAQFSGERTIFSGAQFSGERTIFSEAQFSGEWTDFSEAVFSGAVTVFSEAQFSSERTDFLRAQFSGERTYFSRAQFSGERTYFRGTQFSGERTIFSGAQFSGEWTDFLEAVFSGEWTSFLEAVFSGERTDFTGARFSGERTDFSEAQFRGERTDFLRVQFSGERTYFSRAQFGSADTNFIETTFEKEVTFTEAIFRDNVAFWGRKGNPVFGPGAWARFNYCLIEKPEQFTFNAMSLHPGWFCNTDVRKVDFTDVKWYGMRGCQGTLDEEIRALEARDVQSPHILLSQACQRLATNAEENRSYPLANDFYYWSMEALRKAGWRRLGLIRIMYWVLSGYGVRPGHAFGVLVVIWVVFAALYILVPSSEFYILSPSNSGQVISDVGQAMVYSLGTMARLNPEPKPDPGWFQLTVTFEGLLGPLQIGLLLLAIRRKVMR
jgi:uncharacterized protein YjbI with pentapeptide repeats